MEEQWTDRRCLCHSFKIYCTCYTFNSSPEKTYFHIYPFFVFTSMYIMNPYSHTPSQIFPFFLKTNSLIKCGFLIVQSINQNRSWPGVFSCPSHHPGHLGQVQNEQFFYFYGPACGGREGSWKLDVPGADIWTQGPREDLQCHTSGTAPVTSGTFSRTWAFWGWAFLKTGLQDAFVNFSQGEFIVKSKSTVNYNEE